MSWYTVIKTIKGRQYRYLQTTYRNGGKVRTRNKYLGPVARVVRAAAAHLPTLDELLPDVGQARTIDRYVETTQAQQATEAPAATEGAAEGETGEKAE